MGRNSGQFTRGQKPWNVGKKIGLASRKKMSEARRKFYANGGQHPLLGKKRPDMAGGNNPNSGKFGKEHPKWREDKKRPFYKSIRELFKYRQWRSDIFTRDSFLCVQCGEKGMLQADHYPKRFIDIIREYNIDTIEKAISCEEMWNINNGRTLCVACHRKTETWGRRKD